MDANATVEAGIVNVLAAYTPGAALWGTHIYMLEVPQGATLPYVLVTYFGGGDLNQQPTRMVRERYLVECVSDQQSVARTGAGHIEAALTHATLTLSGWHSMCVFRRDGFQRAERENGIVRHRRGHFFEVVAAKD